MSPLLLLAASLIWIAPQDPRFDIKGAPWLSENKGELIRLPHRLKDKIPPKVWTLGESPSGVRIRFRTDSTRIAIKLAYPSPPNMRNMHAFGQTGVDLYVDGVYRSTAIAPNDATDGAPVEHVFFENLPREERELTIYLPLYKPVKVLGIGLDSDAGIRKARRFAARKPVVFYGTSITQGGCASRPGMSYQAILARRLNLDFVNLGFSGNGKGESAVADMVAEIDASAFVLDFSQNNPTVESLREVYEPFLMTLRTKHPKTPIIAITAIASSRETSRLDQMRQHVRDVVKSRIAQGVHKLPIVFVCENNLWALSAAFADTTAGANVARRAAAYGFPGEEVNGNDVEAVFLAAIQATQRARSGEGPTLLECLSYRHQGHSVFTRDEIRPASEIDLWRRRDPIQLHRDSLLRSGTSGSELDRLEAEAQSRIDAAVQFAKSSPLPDSATAFEGVYT
ncbi:MAG: SGNH/GDSL hydrolase family protein [Bryobacteraceae bacterium]